MNLKGIGKVFCCLLLLISREQSIQEFASITLRVYLFFNESTKSESYPTVSNYTKCNKRACQRSSKNSACL